MESGHAPADGAQIYYESHGSGEPVLFIHAGVADSRMWRDQQHIDGHRCIVFDQRGFGRSALGHQSFASPADALAVLDHLSVEKAVVVGCSIGAKVALHLASTAPERVAGLVLVGGDAPGHDPGIEYESPEWPEAVAAFEAGDIRRVAELDAEIWLAGIDRSIADLDPATVELFLDMDLIALEHETARDELEVTEPLGELPPIEVPVLIIVGDRDLPQLRAAADHLASKLSNRPAEVVADTAHLPSMDQPEAFNRLLTGFLAS